VDQGRISHGGTEARRSEDAGIELTEGNQGNEEPGKIEEQARHFT
jgi:hypothetical protein